MWFKQGPGIKDANGTLQIADYGLARFHERELRSEVDFIKAYSPSTYGLPESKLHRHVSRAYGIWGLGCILLEFITWLLGGSAAIGCFASVPGKIRSGGINGGNYFTITLNGKNAIIWQDVIDWVD